MVSSTRSWAKSSITRRKQDSQTPTIPVSMNATTAGASPALTSCKGVFQVCGWSHQETRVENLRWPRPHFGTVADWKGACASETVQASNGMRSAGQGSGVRFPIGSTKTVKQQRRAAVVCGQNRRGIWGRWSKGTAGQLVQTVAGLPVRSVRFDSARSPLCRQWVSADYSDP